MTEYEYADLIATYSATVGSFSSTRGTFGAWMTQVHYTNKLIALAADSPQLNRVWVMWIVATLMIGGTLASLFFMWNVRRRAAQ